jgi:calcium/calmodulin-dependent protein kinase I
MTGGELFDRIVDKGHFTEEDAQRVCVKLISSIKYIHSMGIAHRDLKPENMLMTDRTESAEVKITDFGLGKFFDEQTTVMQTPCGTPGYIAPEVLQMKGYGKECDIWSLGVIIYILLCGFPPFYADNDHLLFEKIKKGEFAFLRPYWDPISDKGKDLIRKMLTVDPRHRITCDECLQHEWLKATADELQTQLESPKELKKLLAKRKMKAAMLATVAVVRAS